MLDFQKPSPPISSAYVQHCNLCSQVDEFFACEWFQPSILAPEREALDAERKDT